MRMLACLLALLRSRNGCWELILPTERFSGNGEKLFYLNSGNSTLKLKWGLLLYSVYREKEV